jgi:hypothetical protein
MPAQAGIQTNIPHSKEFGLGASLRWRDEHSQPRPVKTQKNSTPVPPNPKKTI